MSNFEFDHEYLESLSYQTPYFLFSKEKVLAKYHEFTKYFPGADIHYAMKANSEPEILKTLAKAGSGFEVASAYEMRILKGLKIPAKTIVYGTSVKPVAQIKEAFEYGVDRFAFDSMQELEKIAQVAPGSRVYARLGVNDTGSVFKFSEKFGTDADSIVPFLTRAKDLGLQPYGISFHVGSQASNPLAWVHALNTVGEIMKHLEKVGIKIEILNIGGGYPCDYGSSEDTLTLEDIAASVYGQYYTLPYQPKLILEPGRGIIASTGVVVASVIARVERSDKTWLFLDAGVYNAVFEAMAYQGSTRYKVASVRPSYNAGEALFALAGPTGDSPDVITREALLPQDIAVGDKLVIRDTGAYSVTVTSRFNGFPAPDVYIV